MRQESDGQARASEPPAAARGVTRVFQCFDCGQFHRIPPMPGCGEARCQRCDARLIHHKTDPLRRTLAWGIASFAILLVALLLPFMDIDLYGRTNHTMLATGATQLDREGMWELGLLVALFTIAAPLVRLIGLLSVLIGLRARHPPRWLNTVLRLAEVMQVWAMLEVYMLGLFVAYTKLIDLAHVDILTAGYALGAFMLLQAMTETSYDREAVWQAMEARGLVHNPVLVAATLTDLARPEVGSSGLIGCGQCGFSLHGQGRAVCPRCGGMAHARKPDAITRCWALLLAAVILYIPANLFPVLTARELGSGNPSTILGGVRELAADGMYPLAILVFFASITVPAVKLIGLLIVLISTHRRSRTALHDRTRLFRVVETIGRWSMIDMFMLSILVGLVQLGFVATVIPGPGAAAFAGVVVLTMLASLSFDPRLMWDAAGEHTR